MVQTLYPKSERAELRDSRNRSRSRMNLQPQTLLLTCPPGSGLLTEDFVAELGMRAAAAGVPLDAVVPLAPGEAAEMPFFAEAGGDINRLCAALVATIGDRAIDANILTRKHGPRRKKLLVADMESTVIEQEMLDEIAERIGLGPRISDITARAMRGELNFEAALRERVGLLAGLDATILDEVAGHITLMPGAETLIQTMQTNGAYCALVSGGFTVFTEIIAKRLGFHEHQANVLEITDGKLTGRVRAPILGRAAKREALTRLTASLGIAPEETLAVGDGANDLDMIKAAGIGVAFRAKPIVRAEAPVAITHGDLTGLLYLQGYARSEFIDPKNIPA